MFIDAEGSYYVSADGADPVPVAQDSLALFISAIAPADSLGAVAVYADAAVPYGKVVDVLNIGAENAIKMVLATKPSSPAEPAGAEPATENNESAE